MEIILVLIFIAITVFTLHIILNQTPVEYKGSNKIKSTEEREHKYKNDGSKLLAGIITAKRRCWKCKKSTTVISIRLFNSIGRFEIDYKPKILYGVNDVPSTLLKKIQERFGFYKMIYNHTQKQKLIANTCEFCGSLQGDFYLYDEPDGPFFNIYRMKANVFIYDKDGELFYHEGK